MEEEFNHIMLQGVLHEAQKRFMAARSMIYLLNRTLLDPEVAQETKIAEAIHSLKRIESAMNDLGNNFEYLHHAYRSPRGMI